MCKTKKRASHTNMFANISRRKKETEKESQTHVCPYRTAHVTPHFPHHINDMYHRHTSLREPRATHSPHLSRPILPICQPTFAFFQGSPPFSRCVTPHFSYISRTSFFWQAKQGEEWTWLQPCRHWMHSACALRFRTTGGTDCPLCRQQVLQWAVHRAGTVGLSTRKRTRASSRLDEEPLACIGDAGEGGGGGRPVTRSTRQRCGASSRSS